MPIIRYLKPSRSDVKNYRPETKMAPPATQIGLIDAEASIKPMEDDINNYTPARFKHAGVVEEASSAAEPETDRNYDSVTFKMPGGKEFDVTNLIAKPQGYKSLYSVLDLPGDPDTRFDALPLLQDFMDEGGKDFVECGAVIYQMYRALRHHFEQDFFQLQRLDTKFFWKDKGGNSAGRDVLGKCTKPTGLLKQYIECDFVIWFGFDHALARQYTNWEVLRLVYHEMRHTAVNAEAKAALIGHEWEGWVDELSIFGPIDGGLRAVIRTAQRLPGFE